MPRPSIIIGVGGTGSWVLSWLKKDLLETHGALEAQPIRLCLLDTADIIAETGRAAAPQGPDAQRKGYSRYIVLDEQTEYIRLPTNREVSVTHDMVNNIRRKAEGVSHISEWFRNPDFYPPDSYNLVDGAAKFRQLGRLAFIQGLQMNGDNDPLYTKLQNMIQDVRLVAQRQGGWDGAIDVHITGSLVGGTGSGVFLDIAWLVQRVSQDIRLHVTGYFAMPLVFEQNPDPKVRARSFAAWRELNRMQIVQQQATEFVLKWGQANQVIFDVQKPAYDHVYLIDSSLTANPQQSAYPIIAEAISFYIDSQSGNKYVQHIRTNLADARTRHPLRNNPTYSVLNLKVWKLPIYHRARLARHEFAKIYLEKLLQVDETRERGVAGVQQTMYRLRANPLYRQRSGEIFSLAMQDTGTTRFLDNLREVSQLQANLVQPTVQAFADPYQADLLAIYADLPETPDAQTVTNALNEYRNMAIPAPSESNDNVELQSYGTSVFNELYGINKSGGKILEVLGDFRANVYKGKLNDVLASVHRFQQTIFQQRIKQWVYQTLNQPADGEFSGLACVLNALEQLSEDFKKNESFWTQIKTQLKTINEVEDNAMAAWNQFQSSVQTRGCLTSAMNVIGGIFGGSPPKEQLRIWLQHETEHLLVKRSHRAIDRILETIQALRGFTENVALASVRAMENQLITGDPFTGVLGLFSGVLDSLRDQEDNHQYDVNLREFMKVLGQDTPLPAVNNQAVEQLLRQTSWSVDDAFNLKIEIQISDDPTDPRIILESNTKDPSQTRRLVSQLVDQVGQYVIVDDGGQTAVDFQPPQMLRDELLGLTNRFLFRQNGDSTVVTDSRTFYIRAMATNQQEAAFRSEMGRLNLPRDEGVDFVNSENRHKIVVFSARELLLPRNFSEWAACEAAYKTLALGDPTRNILADPERLVNDHLFGAEQEALHLEAQFTRESRSNTQILLNHRLVHLLDKRERLTQFVEMWVWGQIRVNKASDKIDYWQVQLSDDSFNLAARVDDMLMVMARYIVYGREFNRQPIQFRRIERELEEKRQTVLNDKTQVESFLAALKFEMDMSQQFFRTVYDRYDRANQVILSHDMRNILDKHQKDIVYPETYGFTNVNGEMSYRPSIAEEFAYDFTVAPDGIPLVSNVEAHMQALEVLLYMTFKNLHQRWEHELRRINDRRR